ncbi:TPA: late orf 2 [Pomona leaf-nosed bat associated polyomavirus]|uniref:late orf 2 n=1 Tax=Pomona leaf-nosed bat associated polyomavirus TaxID=1885565 RepID=UPI000958C22F|nr:late orf 2 [Pomona leaf-nosed bat associated polyomavirus]SCC98883.1 TPA: late orf 2 [Pomona leaf-nosed bat associated polyomavirus]
MLLLQLLGLRGQLPRLLLPALNSLVQLEKLLGTLFRSLMEKRKQSSTPLGPRGAMLMRGLLMTRGTGKWNLRTWLLVVAADCPDLLLPAWQLGQEWQLPRGAWPGQLVRLLLLILRLVKPSLRALK